VSSLVRVLSLEPWDVKCADFSDAVSDLGIVQFETELAMVVGLYGLCVVFGCGCSMLSRVRRFYSVSALTFGSAAACISLLSSCSVQ